MTEYTAGPGDEGKALREVLRRGMGLSSGLMKAAKWHGQLLLNGEPVTVAAPVRCGDVIRVILPEEKPAYLPKPWAVPLSVVYEDERLFVIDKPAPMASQSSAGHPDDSLENALFARLGCPENFVYRPVNRLDKGTSGLMLVAKDGHTQDLCQRLLHTPDLARCYLAVVEGCPEEAAGTVNLPIAKEASASIRRVIAPDGRPSVTHYRLISTDGRRSLIRLRLETGRTHQIRVHMAAIGCPVAGDFLYGSELPELPGRFALHSAELAVRHPFTGELLRFSSPLPDELARLLTHHPS